MIAGSLLIIINILSCLDFISCQHGPGILVCLSYILCGCITKVDNSLRPTAKPDIIYVFMYVCMYVYIYTYVNIYIYMYICIYVYMDIRIYVYVCEDISIRGITEAKLLKKYKK